MPFRASVVRCTIAGSSYGGAEEWSTGFWLGFEETDAGAPTQAAADAIRALWETFFASTRFSNDWSTTSLKLARLAASGNTIDSETVFANIQTNITGTASVGKQAPQVALVATLTSSIARGRASKGRMFLPGPVGTLDSTGHIPNTTRDAMADGLKTFFDGVRASADVPWDPILVAKELATVPITQGINETMTGLKVGNVFDTQRRRRNQLAESYASRVLA